MISVKRYSKRKACNMKLKRISLFTLTLILALALVMCLGSCDDSKGALIEGVTFTDASFTYDGTAKTIEVAGTLPEGATVTYYPANTFTEIGAYSVRATVSAEGYEDLVLVAKLTIVDGNAKSDVTVSFNSNGGPALDIASVTLPYGSTVAAPTTPMYRNGYTFIGWYNGETKWDFANAVTENVTLTASWQLTQFSITYHTGIGATNTNTLYTYTIDTDGYVLTPAVPAEGGEFNFWYVIQNGQPVQITTINRGTVGNLDIYADFTYPASAVTYVLGSDNAVNASQNPVSSNIGTDAQLLYDPTLAGYKFAGWYTTETFDEDTKITHIPAALVTPMTVYAKWEAIHYTINYLEVTGAETPDLTTFTAADEVTLPAAPDRKGYKFAGWVDASGAPVTKIEKGTTANVTVSAVWELATYTITYNDDGATTSVTNPTSYTVNTPTFVLLVPKKTNFTFVGWADEKGNLYSEIAVGSYGDLNLTAKWKANEYSIVYNNINGAVNTNPLTFTVVDEVVLVCPTKPGYVFEGWYDNAAFEGEAVTKIAKGTVTNVVLYAKLVATEFSVNYVLDGGINPLTNPYGFNEADEPIELLPASKVRYTFVGWYDNADFSGNAVTHVDGNASVTLYAKFIPGTEGIAYEAVYAQDGVTVLGYAVVGYTGKDTIVIVPKTYNGFSVIAVKASAFSGNTAITEVVLPASVTSVEADAFFGCTSLEVIKCGILYTTEGYAENWNRVCGESEETNVFHKTVYGYIDESDLVLPEQPL